MTNTKKPFVYTLGAQDDWHTAVVIVHEHYPNKGVSPGHGCLDVQSRRPQRGPLVTIYCASTVAQGGVKILSVSTVVGARGRLRSTSAGGTRSLFLVTNTTLTQSGHSRDAAWRSHRLSGASSARGRRSAATRRLNGVIVTT